MDGQQADMVFTDPPWNLPTRYFSGLGRHRHSDFAMAHGEKSEAEFTSFLSSFLQLSKQASKRGAIVFVFMDWRHLFELLSAARAQELPLNNLVVWAKRNAGMGTFYRSQHELSAVLKSVDAAHLNNFELGQHGRHRSNLWQYAGGNSFHNGRAEELAGIVARHDLMVLEDDSAGSIEFYFRRVFLAESFAADSLQFLPAALGVPGRQLQAFLELLATFLLESRRPQDFSGMGLQEPGVSVAE
jgi:hypothetical protein